MVNEETIKLIEEFEGLRLSAYQDSVGVWTIGYGHTKGVAKGQTITQAEADEFLQADLSDAEAAVNKYVKVPLNENQFGALVSWTYNLGSGNLEKSTLVDKLNAGQYSAVPSEMMKWVLAGGKRLEGLVKRRTAEAALWNTPVSSASVPPPVSLPHSPDTHPNNTGTQTPSSIQPSIQTFWQLLLKLLGFK